ncbi:response regulator [Granulicella sp. dw_53]|uniref:response regulator n=1 Tax=Granulicella sp. dw_53 TaxID=2719792 RepID=UPI001BD4C459|nr:response regulator [Granulicella sp. dw_53]
MQRVLIVDDERLVADTLALVFQKSGFEAHAAYTVNTAMVDVRTFRPDLLLCDITMPGKDGLALVREITRELPSCRIIVLTGFYSNLKIVREEANRLSLPVSILTKPCQPTDLLREANSLLGAIA